MTSATSTAKSSPKATKITLSEAVAIPFEKLTLSQANVRRIANGQSIEDLAEDIAHRGLLQSLSVRPILDEAGAETGRYEVPAGGRRFRALEHLVKTKRMVKSVIHQDIAELRAELAEACLTRAERTEANARLAQLLAKTREREA